MNPDSPLSEDLKDKVDKAAIPTTDGSDSAVSASAKGASFLILLQIGSRALTFALNQILLRFLSPELLGVSVQLELYNISVIYFARESLRVALQRRADGVQAVVNMAYLAVGAGVPLSYFLAKLYLRTEVPQVPYLVQALRLYGVAAVVELLSEPAFVAAQQKLLYKVRAQAEAAATISKTLITVGMVLYGSRIGRDFGVLPFAGGQLAYAFILLLAYIGRMTPYMAPSGFSLLPRRIQSSKTEPFYVSLFSAPLLALTLSLTIQSSIKYVLTQGDSLLIASLASLSDQGAYALSCNYGGLIARMLFQPIEEASRNLFAKLCAPVTLSSTSTAKNTEPRIRQAHASLTTILRAYFLLTLLAFTLGPSLAPLLLRVVAGARWSATAAPSVLAAYTYYIPLLAINGVSEAFVAAVADARELYAQSVWMAGFFAVFAGSAWVFVRALGWGARGVVAANAVNMGMRIVFNFAFVRRFFRRKGMTFEIVDLLPSGFSVAAGVVVAQGLALSTGVLGQYGLLGELVRVGAAAGGFIILVAFFERKFLIQCYKQATGN